MLKHKLNVNDWQLEKEAEFNGTQVYGQNKRQQVDYNTNLIFTFNRNMTLEIMKYFVSRLS